MQVIADKYPGVWQTVNLWHPVTIRHERQEYVSIGHALHAMKFGLKHTDVNGKTFAQLQEESKELTPVPHWELARTPLLYMMLRDKYRKSDAALSALDQLIHDGQPFAFEGDEWLGVGSDGKGMNVLKNLLYKVRQEAVDGELRAL